MSESRRNRRRSRKAKAERAPSPNMDEVPVEVVDRGVCPPRSIFITSSPARRNATSDGTESTASEYEEFSRGVMSKAVACVVQCGGSVDWDRVTEFLHHNDSKKHVKDPKGSTTEYDKMDFMMAKMYSALNELKAQYHC